MVCMDRCLYDLIIGNDVYKHRAVKYDVQQAKVKDGDMMIDMIFENSKFDQNNARLEEARNLNSEDMGRNSVKRKEVPSETEAGVKPSTGVDRLTTTQSSVEEGIIKQSDVTKENDACVAAVQTRAQKMNEAKTPKPLKIKKMEALNISCDEFKQMQKEDEKLGKYWMLKEYHERDEVNNSVVREAVVQESISAVVDEQDEEDWIRVVEISDDEEGNSMLEDRDTETIAAMGVVVDSESEDEECQEKAENSDAVYYSTEQKETWRDVNVNPELQPDQSRRLWELIREYGDVFSDVPTTTHLLEHEIKLTSREPVYSKPYKIPYNLVEPVEKEVCELERQGWIEPSDAAYASPIVVLK